MEDKLYDILTDLLRGDIGKQDAISTIMEEFNMQKQFGAIPREETEHRLEKDNMYTQLSSPNNYEKDPEPRMEAEEIIKRTYSMLGGLPAQEQKNILTEVHNMLREKYNIQLESSKKSVAYYEGELKSLTGGVAQTPIYRD